MRAAASESHYEAKAGLQSTSCIDEGKVPS